MLRVVRVQGSTHGAGRPSMPTVRREEAGGQRGISGVLLDHVTLV